MKVTNAQAAKFRQGAEALIANGNKADVLICGGVLDLLADREEMLAALRELATKIDEYATVVGFWAHTSRSGRLVDEVSAAHDRAKATLAAAEGK